MEGMELITITTKEIGSRAERCVNGRDLHAFLEVGKKFADWIKNRIEEYGFQQGTDYEVFPEFGKNPEGGRPYMEYSLTVDMAKHLCMIEKNKKGHEARMYFIECERRLMGMQAAEEQDFTSGLRSGISLVRTLQKHKFDLADAAQLVWYRRSGLSQREAAKLFKVRISRDTIQVIEGALKNVGVVIPPINATKRQKEMRDILDDMLGFDARDLHLVREVPICQIKQ